MLTTRSNDLSGKLVQIGRIAFLKPAVRQAHFLAASVAGGNKVARDIHAQHVRAEFCAAGNAVVPSPQPRSRTFMPALMPSRWTSASPLSRMLAAMRVKSPFSQRALFGFMAEKLINPHLVVKRQLPSLAIPRAVFVGLKTRSVIKA